MKLKTEISNSPQINYLSRDFSSIKDSLIEFTKTYYPNYKDFSNGSPGVMFMDMASYVGDVLSYYTDYQFSESFGNATEYSNLVAWAKSNGYKPKLTKPAYVTLDVYQAIPSIRNESGEMIPDYDYALIINSGMIVGSSSGVKFVTTSQIDFSINTSENPTTISVLNRNPAGEAEMFVLQKQVLAKSGNLISSKVSISSPEQFHRIVLPENNVIEILKVTDSDGNRWYEVDYLAQDIVYTEYKNIESNNSILSKYKDTVPFVLGSLKTSRKFVTGIENSLIYLEFGSGENSDYQDQEINNIKNVWNSQGISNYSIDPSAFLQGRDYGMIPKNTTLTIEYLVGGGITSNVAANELTNIVSIEISQRSINSSSDDIRIIETLKSTIRSNNPEAATGGGDSDSETEIRLLTSAFFNSQNRMVSSDDYMCRIMSMPAKYGSIAKAHVVSGDEISSDTSSNSVHVYLLTYDNNKNLVPINSAISHNLTQYIRRTKMLTDNIVFHPGSIINLGINFEIVAYKGENKQQLLADALTVVQTFFDVENMSFNVPINLNTLSLSLMNIVGIQSVNRISIRNLTVYDGNYSVNKYDINSALVNNVLYPSLDPSIFEVKYPDKDIVGKIV